MAHITVFTNAFLIEWKKEPKLRGEVILDPNDTFRHRTDTQI